MHTKRIIPCLDVHAGRVVKGINFVNLRDAGDPVEIVKENNQIILRKYSKGCIFCGEDKGIKEFKGMNVCAECKMALAMG